jgi:hypothetical protein
MRRGNETGGADVAPPDATLLIVAETIFLAGFILLGLHWLG